MKNIPYKKSVFAIVFLIVAGAVFYNFLFVPKSTFETFTVKKTDFEVEVFGIGTVDAKEFYLIGPRISGRVQALYKDQGDMVKKGELLAKIDPVELQDSARELEAAIEKAIFSKNAAFEQLEEAKIKNSFQEDSFKRYEKLHKDGFVSKAEFDAISFETFSSRSRVNSAEALLKSADAEIARLENSLAGVKAKIKELSLISPANLFVLSRDAQVGETVVSGKNIFRLVDPKTVWVKVYIDERISGEIKKGQKAKIVLRSRPNGYIAGTVERISPVSDLQTEEREVNVAFDELLMPFFINEQAEVKIATKTLKNTLAVPLNGIIEMDKKSGVWAVEDGKTYFKEVKIIEKSLDGMVAIEGEIYENQKIIIPDSTKKPLKNGTKIKI